tara:strand:+ start:339 stop:533 length:195 start_codon:yes stop_codon:yes gene_type:complete
MTVTTEYGKQNIFAKEPPIQIMDNKEQEILLHDAEELNGRAAMIGFIAAIGAYITTGQIIPGIF